MKSRKRKKPTETKKKYKLVLAQEFPLEPPINITDLLGPVKMQLNRDPQVLVAENSIYIYSTKKRTLEYSRKPQLRTFGDIDNSVIYIYDLFSKALSATSNVVKRVLFLFPRKESTASQEPSFIKSEELSIKKGPLLRLTVLIEQPADLTNLVTKLIDEFFLFLGERNLTAILLTVASEEDTRIFIQQFKDEQVSPDVKLLKIVVYNT